MQIMKKNETEEYAIDSHCIVRDYPLNDFDINGAIIRINGRSPLAGRTANTECKEMAYVIKGEGKIVVNGTETKLQEGDLLLINPLEEYYWEGTMELFVPCTPAWTTDQHKIISDSL
jgi:mannose-6-phosphate isomerase-like protein (cupin superfamily)